MTNPPVVVSCRHTGSTCPKGRPDTNQVNCSKCFTKSIYGHAKDALPMLKIAVPYRHRGSGLGMHHPFIYSSRLCLFLNHIRSTRIHAGLACCWMTFTRYVFTQASSAVELQSLDTDSRRLCLPLSDIPPIRIHSGFACCWRTFARYVFAQASPFAEWHSLDAYSSRLCLLLNDIHSIHIHASFACSCMTFTRCAFTQEAFACCWMTVTRYIFTQDLPSVK